MRRLAPLLLLSALLFGSCATARAKNQAALAEEALRAGRWQQASTLYEEALAHQPDNPQWRYNHLWSLYQSEEYDKVISLSKEAYQDFDGFLEFKQIEAKALLSRGDAKEAFARYEEIFALNPADRALMASVMEAALEAGHEAVAQRLANALIAHAKWERRALGVLDTLYPDSWYGSALDYLNHQP